MVTYSKYFNENPIVFFSIVYYRTFSKGRSWNFTHDGSKHALWRKEVPFGGPHDSRQHFGVQIPQKTSKMASYSLSMFERPRTDSRRMTP